MAFRFFSIPVSDPEPVQTELNGFLAGKMVARVEREFVADGANSFWAVAVEYHAGSEGGKAGGKDAARPGVDYREVLEPEDFAVFADLRELRKELAAQEGVPPYALFNNEQLAAMVTGKPQTLADLRKIDGVGEKKCEKYGERFLERRWKQAKAKENGV